MTPDWVPVPDTDYDLATYRQRMLDKQAVDRAIVSPVHRRRITDWFSGDPLTTVMLTVNVVASKETNRMAPTFSSWDSIPDSSVVPSGAYHLIVEKLDEVTSAKGKLMYKGQFRVVEPKEFENLPVFEQFTIGTDDDPGADDPETWTSPKAVAVRILKGLFVAAKLDMRASVSSLVQQSVGQHVGAVIRMEKEGDKQRDGSPNQYAGQERNRINKFVTVDGLSLSLGATGPLAQRHNQPVAAAPPRPLIRPVAPAPTNSPAPGVAAATRPARPKELMIPCSVCDQAIPRSQWAEHEATHESAAGASA